MPWLGFQLQEKTCGVHCRVVKRGGRQHGANPFSRKPSTFPPPCAVLVNRDQVAGGHHSDCELVGRAEGGLAHKAGLASRAGAGTCASTGACTSTCSTCCSICSDHRKVAWLGAVKNHSDWFLNHPIQPHPNTNTHTHCIQGCACHSLPPTAAPAAGPTTGGVKPSIVMVKEHLDHAIAQGGGGMSNSLLLHRFALHDSTQRSATTHAQQQALNPPPSAFSLERAREVAASVTYDPCGAPFSKTGSVLSSVAPPLSHRSSKGTSTAPSRSLDTPPRSES
jgi:hypothetical protein